MASKPTATRPFFRQSTSRVTIGPRSRASSFRYPWIISGIGSTDIAKNNWEGLAIGSALSGTGLTIGENVVGMDPQAVMKHGRVIDTVDLKRRVKLYQDYQRNGYGAIIVQANIEDTRLRVQEYAIEKLGVEVVELKWGQGAKDIGGEVKIRDLKKAQMLHERGYIVLPDPTDPNVISAFERGAFKEFERHSRVGMVTEESFGNRIEELREAGAKYIFLKTGAYRPADLALALAFASKYQARSAHRGRGRGRHGHESLAHDERMGCAPCGTTFASLSICKISCWKEKICPCIGGERWIHL